MSFAKPTNSGAQYGRFLYRLAGDGNVLVYEGATHRASMPAREFERDGQRMLDAWNKGEPYGARRVFAGALLSPEAVAAAKLEELENGVDASRVVDDWTRYLATSEAKEGGVLMSGLDAVEAEQWPGVVRELFAELYGKVAPVEEVHPGAGWVKQLVDSAEETEQWQNLRQSSEGDAWASGLAAGRIAAALADKARERLQKAPEQSPQRLDADAQAAEELLGATHELTQQARAQAHRAQREGEALLRVLQTSGDVANIVQVAAAKATREIAQVEAGIGQMAGIGSGALRSVQATPDAMRQALTRNPKLRKIAELAGRLRIRARNKQRTKTKYSPESIVDVTIGGELERLLPAELGQLVMPQTELLLMRKLLEREALQYELEGNEEQDRGPVIMAVDGSGSMQGIRNEWAMAVAIAVLEIAAMQRRPFALIHFDNQVQRVFEVPKPGNLKLPELIEMVCYFSGGGTDFAAPLSRAHQMIAAGVRKDGTFAKADVMLVTDGQARWGNWPEQVKATGASLYGVTIQETFRDEMRAELTGLAHVNDTQLQNGSADVDLLFGI